MSILPSPSSARRRRACRSRSRLQLEQLEARDLPAITFGTNSSLLPAESPVNDTLDQATPLTLGTDGTAQVSAVVGDSPAGAADVDFYSFTLSESSHVNLTVHGDGSASSVTGILSLYGADPTSTTHFRVVAQDDGAAHGGEAGLERNLGAGTWYVAISGTGNRYFHPFLADSGYEGDTGTYTLTVAATGLGLTTADGPVLLSSTPAPGSVLSRSPSVLRLAFSRALDKGTFTNSTVHLTYNADGTFGGPGDQTVSIDSLKFVSSTKELLLTPSAPLQAGFYQVTPAGDQLAHSSVITGGGKPLGKDADHPTGQDFVFTFRVDGVEGNTANGAGADDTVDTAHALGDVTDAGLVQVDGAIGDDPTDPVPFNRSDVDLYRFEVSGSGLYAFSAELFAGRIGSSLGAALTLFQLSPNSTDPLIYLASNDSTLNGVQATDGSVPLYSDPALFVGLTAGEYLLAVSSARNFPDEFTPAGTSGIFDPLTTHSGSAGLSRGEYVLNLLVQPAPEQPHVVSVSLADGSTLDGPPTTITVQFDRAVNLQQLSFEAYQLTGAELLPAVFVVASDGQSYFPRLQSYDAETHQATFIFFDAVPAGPAEFHLSGHPGSGNPGIAGLGGAPLVGNEPGNPDGDYVIHFSIADTARGSPGASTYWIAQEPNDTFDAPQVLGPLFPLELASGVTIERSLGTAGSDSADYFQFEVLQTQAYLVALTNVSGLPADVLPEILDGPDHPVDFIPQGDGTILVTLTPGTYVLHVQGWSETDAAGVAYTATITLDGVQHPPTPLTTGPAPALRIRLNDTT